MISVTRHRCSAPGRARQGGEMALVSDVLYLLLAGGQSRRMGGGDKCLQLLGGASLLSLIIGIFQPQVQSLLLNANGDPARFDAFGLPVRPDCFGEFEGPLAGILTAMKWAADEKAQWLFTVAGDAPFIIIMYIKLYIYVCVCRDERKNWVVHFPPLRILELKT